MILSIFIRLFIYYQLLSLAAAAGYNQNVGLLLIDIVLAYIVFIYLWPVFPPHQNTGGNE